MLVIKKLRAAGYQINLERGKQIKLTWVGNIKPDPQKINPLLKDLKVRKEEAVKYLRSLKTSARPRESLLKVKTKALNDETVYFARDKKAAKKAPPSAIVYTLEELSELVRFGPDREILKNINEVKKILKGEIINSKPFL